MRFGILGCGTIGVVHAELLASMPARATIAAVADTSPAAAARLGARLAVPALTGTAKLCARGDIDAISICLPNGLHADAAVMALQAGKHVLIEKPIDITLSAADRIIAAEQASGRTAGVVCQRRFQPAFAFAYDIARRGRLGRLTAGSVQTTYWRPQSYYDAAGWHGTWAAEGGGALMTQGAHAVDLLVWMLGDPVRVSAYSSHLAHQGIEVEDTIAATVQFASGAIGTIGATTAAYPGMSVRLQLNGDAGTAVVDDEVLQFLHTRDAESPDHPDKSNQAERAAVPAGPSSVEAAHAAQYVDFIDAVEQGRPPLITTTDGRRVLALILAAYESARHDGRSVAIS